MARLKQVFKRILMSSLPTHMAIWKGRRHQGKIALTFDDGPDPVLTPQVLAILKAHDVKATFFVIGEKASAHPDLLEQMAREGHELGNHSFTHRVVAGCSLKHIAEEFAQTDLVIAKYTGHRPRLIRPPKGIVSLPFLWYAVTTRRTIALWSIDPNDYEPHPAEMLLERIFKQLDQTADIVLLHERHMQTVELLPKLLDRLASQHMQCVTVSHLVSPG